MWMRVNASHKINENKDTSLYMKIVANEIVADEIIYKNTNSFLNPSIHVLNSWVKPNMVDWLTWIHELSFLHTKKPLFQKCNLNFLSVRHLGREHSITMCFFSFGHPPSQKSYDPEILAQNTKYSICVSVSTSLLEVLLIKQTFKYV